MHTAFIAFGSNLGDRRQTIQAAAERLRHASGVTEVVLSTLHETTPVGGPPDQPAYLNAVARVVTALEAEDLLRLLLQVENALGRVRTARWGPRTIDLDLLLYEDRIIETPDLTVPHPRMHERRFVLEPLAELAPGWQHPKLGRSVAELLADLT